jgi:hypothetical protein
VATVIADRDRRAAHRALPAGGAAHARDELGAVRRLLLAQRLDQRAHPLLSRAERIGVAHRGSSQS